MDIDKLLEFEDTPTREEIDDRFDYVQDLQEMTEEQRHREAGISRNLNVEIGRIENMLERTLTKEMDKYAGSEYDDYLSRIIPALSKLKEGKKILEDIWDQYDNAQNNLLKTEKKLDIVMLRLEDMLIELDGR